VISVAFCRFLAFNAKVSLQPIMNPQDLAKAGPPHSFPSMIRTARKAYELAELPKPAEIEALAQAWRPYCSVAAWYLWRSLENQAAL
jgi:hypothetical protein